MREITPSRARPASAILLALGTIVALLVAPVCASLCAVRGCSFRMGQPQCHDMASMGANNDAQLAAPSVACRSTVLLAVLAKTGESSFRLQKTRIAFAPIILSASPERGFSSLGANPGHAQVHRGPLPSPNSLLLKTILRI